MQNVEANIVEYIQTHPNTTAKDLVKNFDMHKSDINKFLYAQKTKKVLDNDGATPPKWFVVDGSGKISPKKNLTEPSIIIFIDRTCEEGFVTDILEKLRPYLSEKIQVVLYFDVSIKSDFVKRFSIDQNDDDLDIIAFGLWAARRQTKDTQFLLISGSSMANFVSDRLMNATVVPDGWEGLRVFVE